MHVFIVVLSVILGWGVGAFFAHVAEAVMVQRPLARPQCPYCNAVYVPLQWSAILALVTGNRRCRQCAHVFRWPRLIGELFLAAVWGLLVGRYGVSAYVLFAMLASIPLEMLMVTDLETKRIPNRIVLPSILGMLVLGTVFGPALPFPLARTWWQSLAGAAVGFLVLRILVTVGVAIFGEGALGEGDMTLATYIGGLVGFPMVIESLVLAFVLGGFGALIVLLVTRANLRTAIPYGPYLVLGCAVSLIWGPEITAWFFL